MSGAIFGGLRGLPLVFEACASAVLGALDMRISGLIFGTLALYPFKIERVSHRALICALVTIRN